MTFSKKVVNSISNSIRAIGSHLSKPQQKAIREVLIGLLIYGTPILNHLNINTKLRIVKQSERYRRNLENVVIEEQVQKRIFRMLPEIGDDTVIAYDLSDIAKPHAKVMEGLSNIFDGSERKVSIGYSTHGVSIHNLPVIFRLHDADRKTINQTRRRIINEVVEKTGKKGIWVFDRGNDDQKLFSFLSQKELRFIVRIKRNRKVIIKETGEYLSIQDIEEGSYRIILPTTKEEYMLVVKKWDISHPPIRVITNVEDKKTEEIIETYLARWEVENIFKQMKTKFSLEQVRLLSMNKIKSLLALIQLATTICNQCFEETQKEEQRRNDLDTWKLYKEFKEFCYQRCVTQNRCSFTSFVSVIIPPVKYQKPSPSKRLCLFSNRQMKKMGVF